MGGKEAEDETDKSVTKKERDMMEVQKLIL